MEMENSTRTYRIHRVGSVTAGLSMVVFGVLLLLQSVFDMLSYERIFALWPLILIGLGVELLLSNLFVKKIVYDKAAVFLLVFMTFFVVAMAFVDVCMEAGRFYMY